MTANELHYKASTLIGAAEDIRDETDHYWNQLNSLTLAVEENHAVWKGSGADFLEPCGPNFMMRLLLLPKVYLS